MVQRSATLLAGFAGFLWHTAWPDGQNRYLARAIWRPLSEIGEPCRIAARSAATKSAFGTVRPSVRRATRRHFSAEDKIRIVLEGLRGEDSIAELCRREGIVQNLYYRWSKDFLEAGKKRLAGDTARAATSDEVKDLRRLFQLLSVGNEEGS
jgi:transposase